MRTKSRVLAAVALAVLVPLGAAPVQAQAKEGQAAQSDQYCVVVVGKASGPEEVSPELYRHCQTMPFDTRAHLRSKQAQESYAARNVGAAAVDSSPDSLAAAASYKLMTAWSDANYKGTSWAYYGGAECDQYGYRWDPDSYWRSNLSSVQYSWEGNCNSIRLHTKDLSKWQEFGLGLPYVGSTYNDNVGRTQIWHA